MKVHQYAKAQIFIVKITATLVVILMLVFAAIDYGNRQLSTYEATVAVKKPATRVDPEDSLFMLVIVRDNRVWQTRVAKVYYDSVSPGDKVVIEAYNGLLTGFEYDARLWTRKNDITPIDIHRAEVLQ